VLIPIQTITLASCSHVEKKIYIQVYPARQSKVEGEVIVICNMVINILYHGNYLADIQITQD